jgi:hypothetical protein
MKTNLLAIIALAFSASAVCADSAIPSRLGLAPIPATVTTQTHGTSDLASVPALSLAADRSASPAGFKLESSSANFAQLGTSSQAMPLALPLSPGLIMAFVAIFVLALRIIGLNHARAMAEHERNSYQGKARMFRALHEGDTNR